MTYLRFRWICTAWTLGLLFIGFVSGESDAAAPKVTPRLPLAGFQADPAMLLDFSRFRDLEHFNRETLEGLFSQARAGDMRVSGALAAENSLHLRRLVTRFGMEFCRAETGRCSPGLEDRLGRASPDTSQTP